MSSDLLFATFLILAAMSAAEISTRKDYCQFKCGNTPNIACNFQANCPSKYYNYQDVNLTKELIEVFVAEHNDVRRKTILGETEIIKNKTSPRGSNMLKLVWNPELAYLASLTVKSCQMIHDCPRTEQHNGQNLFSFWTTGKADLGPTIKMAIKYWASESRNTPSEQLEKFTSTSYEGKVIGHYTQVVWAKSSSVGCGYSTFKEDAIVRGKLQKRNHHLIACNYVSGNIIGTPVYEFGEPCSACPNSCEDSLCLKYS